MPQYCIYQHTGPNGKSYIGQTKQGAKRWCHPTKYKLSTAFYNAILKYGWENFEHKILYSELSLEDANRLEMLTISELNTMVPNGYNLTAGGEGQTRRKMSQETKDKIRDALTGRTKETCQYLADAAEKRTGNEPWNKGKSFSDDEYQKMVDAGFIGARKGKPGTMTGKKHPPEQIEKMKLARQGKNWFTNGIENVFTKEQPIGFSPGRTLKKK